MEQSTNYNFNLPSKSDETSADIDLISDNFRTVDDVVKQVDDVVKQVKDDVSKIPTNLVNGSADGSLRGIDTWPSEDDEADYKIGENAVTLGIETRAKGRCSFAEGYYTTANGYAQHVKGRYNIPDNDNKYADIVGNGYYNTIFDNKLSNAHTLDWDGNAWFAGDVYVGGTSQDDENATKLSSVATDITQVKEKLDGIEEGANKTIVDSELSDTSTNPLQNKVVTEKINSANSNITSTYKKLDKKVNLTNGTIYGAVDWNTITKTGCYKIQNCTMTADYNAPVDEYRFGVLQVLNSEWDTGTTDKEHRVLQIYIPHRHMLKYGIHIRSNNSVTGYNDWTDWVGFYNAKQVDPKLETKASVETGICTLTVSNGTVSNATYSVVGNMVTLNFNIAPTGAGNVVVSGLPFTATKNQSGFASSTATYNITANQTSVSINSTSGTAEYCTVTYLK